MCSFLQGNACLAPIEYPTTYDSWYECSRDAHTESVKLLSKMGYAHVESVKLLSKMGYAHVNKYRLGTKYNCRAVYTY